MRRIPWLRLQTCSSFENDLIFPDFLNTDIIWGYNNETRMIFVLGLLFDPPGRSVICL